MLSFHPFLKLSDWGEGGRYPGPSSLLPHLLSQTSLLGTPQGQLLLSLGAPLR